MGVSGAGPFFGSSSEKGAKEESLNPKAGTGAVKDLLFVNDQFAIEPHQKLTVLFSRLIEDDLLLNEVPFAWLKAEGFFSELRGAASIDRKVGFDFPIAVLSPMKAG